MWLELGKPCGGWLWHWSTIWCQTRDEGPAFKELVVAKRYPFLAGDWQEASAQHLVGFCMGCLSDQTIWILADSRSAQLRVREEAPRLSRGWSEKSQRSLLPQWLGQSRWFLLKRKRTNILYFLQKYWGFVEAFLKHRTRKDSTYFPGLTGWMAACLEDLPDFSETHSSGNPGSWAPHLLECKSFIARLHYFMRFLFLPGRMWGTYNFIFFRRHPILGKQLVLNQSSYRTELFFMVDHSSSLEPWSPRPNSDPTII